MTATEHAAKRQALADKIRKMLAHGGIKPTSKQGHLAETSFLVGYLTSQQDAGAAPDPYLTLLIMSGRRLTDEFKADTNTGN